MSETRPTDAPSAGSDAVLISADSHVLEPPNLWLDYIEPAYRDTAPHIVSEETEDKWYIRDTPIASIGTVSAAGKRFENLDDLKLEGRWDAVPKAAYQPADYVKAMALDGVGGAVIYPTQGLFWYRIPDVDLANAVFRAYNRWLADFCSAAPGTLKGIAMILLEDVDASVAELEHASESGLVGAMLPVFPSPDMDYFDPRLEPMWEKAEELGLPLSLHVGSNRPGQNELGADLRTITPATRTTLDYWVRHSMTAIIFSGVFERHPGLKILSVEHELGWIPHFLKQMDFTYDERRYMTPVRFAGNRRPSDVWKSNVYTTFMEDDLGIEMRDRIGVNHMMWGSDYPHAESTWPRSRQILDTVLSGVSASERRMMTHDSAAELFRFD